MRLQPGYEQVTITSGRLPLICSSMQSPALSSLSSSGSSPNLNLIEPFIVPPPRQLIHCGFSNRHDFPKSEGRFPHEIQCFFVTSEGSPVDNTFEVVTSAPRQKLQTRCGVCSNVWGTCPHSTPSPIG